MIRKLSLHRFYHAHSRGKDGPGVVLWRLDGFVLPMTGPSKRIRPFNHCVGDTRLVSQALGTIFDFLFSLVKGKASSDQGTLYFFYFFNFNLRIPYTTYTHTNQLVKVTNRAHNWDVE